MRGFQAAALIPVLVLSAAACSTSQPPPNEVATPPTLGTDAFSQSQESSQATTGIILEGPFPFDLEVYSKPASAVEIFDLDRAVGYEATGDFLTLGQTLPGDYLPGPSVRTLVDGTHGFGVLLTQLGEGEITDLAQLPAQIGSIHTDGTFEPLPQANENIAELPGSNPDGLYFEPQNASSFENWIVWREGSAGEHGAMPTLDTLDWRLVALNQDTGDLFELGSAYLLHGDRFAPRSPWDGSPTTDGEKVYFEAYIPATMVTPEEAPGANVSMVRSVLAADLNNPGEVEILSAGTAPTANQRDGGAMWVSNLRTVVQDKEPLFSVTTEGWSVRALTSSEHVLVAAIINDDGEPGWLLVWDLEADSMIAAGQLGADWAEMSVSGQQIVWGNGTANSDPTMYFMDLANGDLITLGATQGFSLPKISKDLLAVPRTTEHGAIIWEFLERTRK